MNPFAYGVKRLALSARPFKGVVHTAGAYDGRWRRDQGDRGTCIGLRWPSLGNKSLRSPCARIGGVHVVSPTNPCQGLERRVLYKRVLVDGEVPAGTAPARYM